MASIDLGPFIVPDEQIQGDKESSLSEVGKEETSSSTESLTNSIFDYQRENGRTYHRYKDGKYNLPNDAQERERLDLQHHLFLLTFDNKLSLAPLGAPGSKVKRVLDLGAGSGIWTIDFADQNPGAHVIGIDLSPIQPSFVPPNVEFFVDDIDDEWNHSQPFDYIHRRMMSSSIEDCRVYLQKIYDNLAPGGYAELQEADLFLRSDDGTLAQDHALSKCLQLMYDASVEFGREFQEIEPLRALMEEIGFVDVVRTRRKWPINAWPRDQRHKELGAWSRMNLENGLEAFTMAPLTRALGWSREEVTMFLADVRKDLDNRRIHAYWPVYSIYGRKPE